FPEADIRVALHRPPTTDGSRLAEGKDRVVGPRAGDIVAAGLSKSAATFVFIAGVPIGSVGDGLKVWRERYTRKLARLRDIAAVDPALAAHAASTIGGPAGLANHILRSTPPTEAALAFWREVDAEWVAMWCDILRLDGRERAFP